MRALLSVVAFGLLASSAFAALAVVDPAFAVQSVIPGWTSAPLAFTKDGTLWAIKQTDGCLYKFPGVSGNPSPATAPIKASTHCLSGFSWDWGIVATSSDRLFTAHGYELTAMMTGGSPVQKFGAGVLPGNVRGIAVDPTTGDIIIGGYPSGKIFRVQNPETNAAPSISVLNTDLTNGGIDGIWVGPDGVIYAAGYDQARLLVVNPSGSILARPQVTDYPQPQAGYGPDGVAVAGNNTFLITSRSHANRISKWTIPDYTQSLIATTNGYTDYSTVGPDGCMYISSLGGPDGVIRLTNHDGTCSFQNPTTDSGNANCVAIPGHNPTGDYSYDSGMVNQKKLCFKVCEN